MRRRLNTGPLAAAVGGLLIAASLAGSAPATGADAAPSLFLSTSGSDAGSCTRARPCRSFDRAYRVAMPGAVVEVAPGAYPGQAINPDRSKTSAADVVFRPAARAKVTVTGELRLSGAHLELRGMTLNDLELERSANDVTIRDVVNHGFWIQGSSNVRFLSVEVTCGACPFHPHMQNGGPDAAPPRNIVFDRVNFHDWHSVGGEHTECLQILGGDGVTIRNSIFRRCGTARNGLGSTADLHLQAYGRGPVPRNILLENNFFYPSGNPFVIQGEDFADLDLRYNSLAGPILLYDGPGPGTGIDIVGNVMRFGGCTAQSNGVPIGWRYNVMEGGTCGRTDRNARAGFVDPRRNLHLAPGSPAIDAGDPSRFPRRDIDGQRRPARGRPDAGADERR